MDFGYYKETPIRATQYYDVLLKICKDKSKIRNFIQRYIIKNLKKNFILIMSIWYKNV